jgi:Mn2+/Fe2+ NRAMP family transporter
MKKIFEVALGVVTGIGGFLEVGSLATSAQAGADFGYRLLWAVALGTVGLIVLVEMSGRLAAVSGHTLAGAMRERFGWPFFAVAMGVVLLVSLMVLSSEIAGVALALQMASGIDLRWWAVPLAFVAWALLWKGTFSVIEYGTAGLGLVSVAFLVAALRLHPSWASVGSGFLPTRPVHHAARYWFLAVSILGAAISPYLFLFYSAGAIEDRWDVTYVAINRLVASLGNVLGGTLAASVLVVGALVFHARGIGIDRYEQLGMMLTGPLGRWGFALFLVGLGVNCFGATAEITLASAYVVAQGLGWPWGEDAKPHKHARFSLTYTVVLAIAAIPTAAGVDPLRLTNQSMAATAACLPVTILPMLVLMKDGDLLQRHTNGWMANAALGLLAALSIVLLVVALPLQLLGG